MQYFYYSTGLHFHHQTHPQLSVVSTLVQLLLFFLKLLVIALYSSPVTHWTPSNQRGSSSGVISFCLLIPFMGFSLPECWSVLPFPPPVDHVLSALFTVTHLSWVALHGMAYSFIDNSYSYYTENTAPEIRMISAI